MRHREEKKERGRDNGSRCLERSPTLTSLSLRSHACSLLWLRHRGRDHASLALSSSSRESCHSLAPFSHSRHSLADSDSIARVELMIDILMINEHPSTQAAAGTYSLAPIPLLPSPSSQGGLLAVLCLHERLKERCKGGRKQKIIMMTSVDQSVSATAVTRTHTHACTLSPIAQSNVSLCWRVCGREREAE